MELSELDKHKILSAVIEASIETQQSLDKTIQQLKDLIPRSQKVIDNAPSFIAREVSSKLDSYLIHASTNVSQNFEKINLGATEAVEKFEHTVLRARWKFIGGLAFLTLIWVLIVASATFLYIPSLKTEIQELKSQISAREINLADMNYLNSLDIIQCKGTKNAMHLCARVISPNKSKGGYLVIAQKNELN